MNHQEAKKAQQRANDKATIAALVWVAAGATTLLTTNFNGPIWLAATTAIICLFSGSAWAYHVISPTVIGGPLNDQL